MHDLAAVKGLTVRAKLAMLLGSVLAVLARDHDAKVTGEQWTGCSGNATVVHYRMEGGYHAWPGNTGGQSGTSVIWLFFKAQPLTS